MSETNDETCFSFIIPTYNEEAFIGQTIADVQSNFKAADAPSYEIVIVDNGSSDSTVEIAKNAGCTVLDEPTLNISQMRNRGVAASRGDLLVFIDADVSLTPDWLARFEQHRQMLANDAQAVIGSHYRPATSTPYPLRHWFVGGYENPRSTFLPGGHMIMSRHSFNDIGGFSADYRTGEDVELCQRASTKGYDVVNIADIGVIHRGDPQTIGQFLKRECWHGSNDFRSLANIAASTPAKATLIFVVLHIALLGAALFGCFGYAVLFLCGILGLCAATSWHLFPRSALSARLANIWNAWLYYLGRSCSIRSFFSPKSSG